MDPKTKISEKFWFAVEFTIAALLVGYGYYATFSFVYHKIAEFWG